jgi:carboxyl-terminal processing protease
MLQDLNKIAKSLGVEYDAKDFEQSKALIRNNTKALIARSVWDNKGSFPIFNENNEVFQKALELFDEAEKLAKM